MSPKTACLFGNCPNPAVYRGRCNDHRKDIEAGRPSAYQRGYDAYWLKRRREYLASHPTCEACTRAPAVSVDHRKRLRDCQAAGWSPEACHADSNLAALCRSCHSKKTVAHDGALGHRPRTK